MSLKLFRFRRADGCGIKSPQRHFTNTNNIMNNTFWIGVYPGLNDPMLEYVCNRIETFLGVNF